MPSIVDDIKSCTDDILGIRDDLGALKHPIYILTRTWDGQEIGDGTAVDNTAQILPTPYLVDYSHSIKIREGGAIREGDIVLKMISKQSYPNESDIDCTTATAKIEKFYYIDGKMYEVVSVTSEYVYWNVHLRRTAKQKTYL